MATNNSADIITGALNTLLIGQGIGTSPIWTTATYPATTTINQLLYSSSNNVISGLATANSAALVTSATGVPTWAGPMLDGYVIIGATGLTPQAGTIVGGPGITVALAGYSIVVNNTTLGALIADQTTTPFTFSSNTIYISDTAGLLTFNVPVGAQIGTQFQVVGKGAGGWLIQFAAGQTCNFNSTATSVAGSLASTNRYNCITIMCVDAGNTYTVVSSEGVITVA
jgi:hypothetical protein